MGEREDVRRAVQAMAPTLDRALVDDYFARLDQDYLDHFSAEDIAGHVRLAAALGSARPLQLEVRRRGSGEYEVTAVAYDYFGELALLCGLLTSFGLDIRSGRAHTLDPVPEPETAAARHKRPGLSRIVDVFVVRPAPGVVFDAEQQTALRAEAQNLLRLVSAGELAQARDRLNLRLVERLESQRDRLGSRTYDLDVRFDDSANAGWTVMDVRAQDTPAFLYALVNALSLRGVYIHRVEIDSRGSEVRDRFFIADRARRPIEAEAERSVLRTAVGLTKQFTHYLTSAPNPAAAIHAFDQLVDALIARDAAGRSAALLGEADLDALAHLLGSSRFLWEDFLRTQASDLLPLLGQVKRGPLPRGRSRASAELGQRLRLAAGWEERRRALNDYKDRSMVLIDLKQLLDPSVGLPEFSAALTELAEAVVDAALTICRAALVERHGQPRLADASVCPVTLLGLGKFGGGELGYASDVELMCVYGGPGRSDGPEVIENGAWHDALVRALLELIEARRDGIFEIDLRLRPYGRKGPLASVMEQFETYYSHGGDAASFERQALVKLRAVAGDDALGRRAEAAREDFVYDRAPWERDQALHLRGRQLRELVAPGTLNVKYGAGGLIDVEYTVQYLQVQHGPSLPDLRTPNTLAALDRLQEHGIVSDDEHRRLRQAYAFLRQVIDALRMVRGNAKDLVLPKEGSEEYKFLARRLGLMRETWTESAAELTEALARHMSAAHEIYVCRFGDPRLL